MTVSLKKSRFTGLIICLAILAPQLGELCRSQSLSISEAFLLAEKTATDSTDTESSGQFEGWTTKPNEDKGRQSPSAAMFKSLLVPGLGQIGNRKYLKAALVIGGETFLFLRWLDYRNQTVDARAAFEAEENLTLRGELFAKFDNVREKRNLNAWFTGTVIFASMIDALVDAHLAKFPAPEKKLSFDLEPTMSENQPVSGFSAKITWRF
jgi:Family of unknown function (DUF5683)